MSYEDQVKRLRAIEDAILDEAPRNKDNELLPPYSRWVRNIDRDLERLEAWRQGHQNFSEHKEDGNG